MLSHKFRIQIKTSDLRTLTGLQWLNDAVGLPPSPPPFLTLTLTAQIINFYFQMIAEHSKLQRAHGNCVTPAKVHTLSSFVYPKLLQTGYEGVRRWIRKVCNYRFSISSFILSIDTFLSIRLTFSNRTLSSFPSTWVHTGVWQPSNPTPLASTTPGNTIFNSQASSLTSLLHHNRNYLTGESLDKRGVTFDHSAWQNCTPKDIPKQLNSSDCGVFSCMVCLPHTFHTTSIHNATPFCTVCSMSSYGPPVHFHAGIPHRLPIYCTTIITIYVVPSHLQADMAEIRSHMMCEIIQHLL